MDTGGRGQVRRMGEGNGVVMNRSGRKGGGGIGGGEGVPDVKINQNKNKIFKRLHPLYPN